MIFFQDFPGPIILKKKIQDFPGDVGTLPIVSEACLNQQCQPPTLSYIYSFNNHVWHAAQWNDIRGNAKK